MGRRNSMTWALLLLPLSHHLRKSRPCQPFPRLPLQNPNSSLYSSSMAPGPPPQEDPDELLCSSLTAACSLSDQYLPNSNPVPVPRPLTPDSRIKRAWVHWNSLGAPKLVVAPMVDNSELPFRLLCRKYGAQAAYTPMLHSRIFSGNEKYRSMEFTTCKVINLKGEDFF